MTALLSSNIDRAFYAIRSASISGSSRYIWLAFTIASFFLVFKLIRFTYDLVSDEQTGGLGGIKVWELVRPIFFLFLVMGSSLVVGATDSVCNMISSGIESTIPSAAGNDEFKKIAKNLEEQEAAQFEKENNELLDEARQHFKSLDIVDGIVTGSKILWRNIRIGLKAMFTGLVAATTGTVLPAIANWLFSIWEIVYKAVAEIYLCIYAMFFPLVIALSILDVWKGSLVALMTKYLQISLWKVLISCIAWIVSFARIAVLRDPQLAGDALSMMGQETAYLWVAGFVSIAGIFAISHVPAMAGDIIQAATSASNSNIAGSIVSAPAKAAKAVVK